MSAKAELKHTAALFAVATGALSVFVAVCTAVVAFNKDAPGWFVCTALAGLVGLWQIRSGVKMRNRAVAEGADPNMGHGDGSGQTSRTGTRKPSFLDRGKKEADDE